jgi:hypothetical protein
LKEKDHYKDINVDGRIILKYMLKDTAWEEVNYIYVAQDEDKWRALNTIINLRES